MCDCGCNTCETKSTLMLNESLAPRDILSEGLKYHMDANKPLTEHLYRAGSDNYFNLWAEARSLYSREILEITHEDDLAVLTETDLGHYGLLEQTSTVSKRRAGAELKQKLKGVRSDGFGKYDATVYGLDSDGKRVELKSLNDLNKFDKFELAENKKVPLDFPIELNEQMDLEDELANMEFGMDYDQLGDNEKEWVRDEIDNMNEELTIAGKKVKTIHKNDSNNPEDHEIEYEDGTKEPYLKHVIKEAFSGFLRNPEDPDSEKFEPTGPVAEFREDLRALFGKFKGDLKNPEFIKGVAQIMVNWKSLLRSQLDENKKLTYNDFVQMVKDDMMAGASPDEKPSEEQVKKKAKAYYNDYLQGASVDSLFEAKKKAKKNNKKLNKPMRDSSGGKAYKVYVKDPKTKKIKTVRFGSGGLRAKINDKKARNAFAKRHKCSTKKDKTKAGYWSCRLPRYAKLLGLKSNFGGFW